MKLYFIQSYDENCPENNNGYPPISGIFISKIKAEIKKNKLQKENDSYLPYLKYYVTEYETED